MSLTTTDKYKINKYIRENKMGNIYYQELCDVIGKRGKVSDLEFLEYFTDSVLNEFRKETKISVKYVAKLVQTVDTFLEWINNQYIKVPDSILTKIKSFADAYKEHAKRVNVEIDEELINTYINPLIEVVKKQTQKSKKTDAATKYMNQAKELEIENETLKKELKNVQRQLEKSEKTVQQKQEKVDLIGSKLTKATNENKIKSNEVKKLGLEVKEQNLTIKQLEEKIKIKSIELEEKVKLLESELEVNSNLTEEIKELKRQLELLEVELNELQKKIKDEERRQKQFEKLMVKEENLKSLIYENLLTGDKSIDALVEIATNEGISTNNSQILELLKEMRSEINITSGNFLEKPTYRITAPLFEKNGEFNISLPYDTKYYDIMLVSDFHITEFDDKVISVMDRLNEYCAKNGIKLILNLGDFFEGFGVRQLEYGNAIKNYRLIEDCIKSMPKSEGLYHAILRGNHDRNITNYGFDPIKILTSEREDLIDLGYRYSCISISNPETNLGEFGIHHPDTFDFPIDLGEDGIESDKVEEYLKRIYSKNNRSMSNSYIDIFGHTHKSQFNYTSGYCFVPPYLKKYARKGAVHLRIYFDVDNKIKSMVFMTLDYNDLSKNNEIVWQKQIKK